MEVKVCSRRIFVVDDHPIILSGVGAMINSQDDRLRLTIEDDGRGFDGSAEPGPGHLGLAGMRERLALVGGKLSVETARGKGTTIYADVPLAG